MRHFSKAALFLTAAFVVLPAHAEESEIVVTATRAEVDAARLPARIDVIDRDEIETRSLATLSEALGSDALQSGGGGQQASLFLRGANSKHALALFDGIRLNDAAGPTAAYDFGQDLLGAAERVEVLRGPASAIYGSDAIGGIVNVIPRLGGDTAFEPFLELSGGSFDTRRGLVGASGETEGWSYGVSAETFSTDGFDHVPERFATRTGDADGAAIDAFTGALRYEATGFALDALARTRRSDAEYDTFSGGPGFDLRADDPDLDNDAEQTLWRLGAEVMPSSALEVRLSGGEVRSAREEADDGVVTIAADSLRVFSDLVAIYHADALTLTGGLAYEHNEIDTRSPFADPLRAAEEQYAAYLIGQWDLSAAIVATGSVRVDDYEAFGTQTTYAFGAVADLAPLRLYASYGTAFKAPSLSERYETSFFNVGNPDLAPEESRSWEAGVDWALNDAVRLGASYYETHIDNLIEYDFAVTQNVNIGEAAIEGAEAFLEASLNSWSSLRVSYAWTDARDAVSGQQLARRPEHAWSLDARIEPTERLTLALRWTYAGERTDVLYADDGTFAQAAGVTEGFSIGALTANYDIDARAEIFTRIDNITDETYELPNAYAGAPRIGYLGVRARF